MKERGTTGARHLKRTHGRGTTGNAILLGRTSGIRPLSPYISNDPRQYGDGRGEVIPSFDETDFRQERKAGSSFLCPTQEWPQRGGLVNWWSDWKDVHSCHVKEYRTWNTKWCR